jgi:plastocyanin
MVRFPTIMRQALALLVIVVGLGPAAVPASAATTWFATAGAESPDHSIQALAFLPNLFTVNVGDQITWTFPTAGPHTVTFGPPPANPFGPQLCNGAAPVVADFCDWNGVGTANSGIKLGGGQYTVRFNTIGSHEFVCLLHPAMTGTVRVQAEGSRYPETQSEYFAEGKRQEAQLLRRGSERRGQLVAQGGFAGKENRVIVGSGFITSNAGGQHSVSIDRFFPQSITVNVGEEVTWTAQDPATPHTVTFGAEPAGNPATPVGLDGANHATLNAPYPTLFVGPTVNSGFLGQPFPSQMFVVRFNALGTYRYYCALHADLGMVGTVNVIP